MQIFLPLNGRGDLVCEFQRVGGVKKVAIPGYNVPDVYVYGK